MKTRSRSWFPEAAAGSLGASFSLDPFDLLKLAGSRISATDNQMPRWAVAKEAGSWKSRLMERTVELTGLFSYLGGGRVS